MTDPQAAQLGAVAAGLIILAFYGVVFAFLALGACHLWLDLRERLAERREKRQVQHGPSGPPPLKLRRSSDPAKPQFPPPRVIREDRWP